MKNCHVLIIDDHTLFRTGLCMILNENPIVANVIEAGSIREACDLPKAANKTCVSIILLDIQLPGINGLDGIKVLNKHYSKVPIIVLSASDSSATIQRATDCGAKGYLPKSATASAINDGIRCVMEGGSCFPSLSMNGKSLKSMPPDSELTARQLEVLSLLCEGLSNKLIARELGVAENTIRGHVSAILAFLNISRRSQAIIAAQKIGLIK